MPSQNSGPTVGLDLSVTKAEAERPGQHIPGLIVVVMNVKRRDPMLADVGLPLDDDEVISRRAKNVSRELLDVHCSALSRRQTAPAVRRVVYEGVTLESKHIGERIDRPTADFYEYASDPALPEWAPGLGSSVENVAGRWFVETAMGRVGFAFAERNEYGVLDHEVTLPSGEVLYNPMRVVPDGSAAKSCSPSADPRT
jgi:hypothetical protein